VGQCNATGARLSLIDPPCRSALARQMQLRPPVADPLGGGAMGEWALKELFLAFNTHSLSKKHGYELATCKL